jgi:3-hydroxyisobutyrate dehydrogenase-like beta-hydroxyacid dehydrogenase
MGSGVGTVLRAHGISVFTSLEGRSARTRDLAVQAGIEDAGTITELVRSVDTIFCIVVPEFALSVANNVAAAIRETGSPVLYVDCNAVAPATVRAAAEEILRAGGRFADIGILGGPPSTNPGSRFMTSGPGAEEVSQLRECGLNIKVMQGDIGAASGLKMCFAAMSKGLQALGVELLVAARLMGIEDDLRTEQEDSQAGPLSLLRRSMPAMTTKAHRWVSEMEEIAQTFSDLGFSPELYQSVANVYRWVATTPLAEETPENRDRSRDLYGVVDSLAEAMTNRVG